jgi:diaminopimelate epimerase
VTTPTDVGSPRSFWKMSGSGNDFVVFDTRNRDPGPLAATPAIRSICARRTGVGADGVVFLESWDEGDFRMRYYNADGSRRHSASLASRSSLAQLVRAAFASRLMLAF